MNKKHGGIKPKGTTKGGGPNGEAGLSNSVKNPDANAAIKLAKKLALREQAFKLIEKSLPDNQELSPRLKRPKRF